jgi:hypothetical protein
LLFPARNGLNMWSRFIQLLSLVLQLSKTWTGMINSHCAVSMVFMCEAPAIDNVAQQTNALIKCSTFQAPRIWM